MKSFSTNFTLDCKEKKSSNGVRKSQVDTDLTRMINQNKLKKIFISLLFIDSKPKTS